MPTVFTYEVAETEMVSVYMSLEVEFGVVGLGTVWSHATVQDD